MKHVKRSGRSGDEIKRRYLSRAEVARLFEVSPATVARWAREGRLPYVSDGFPLDTPCAHFYLWGAQSRDTT